MTPVQEVLGVGFINLTWNCLLEYSQLLLVVKFFASYRWDSVTDRAVWCPGRTLALWSLTHIFHDLIGRGHYSARLFAETAWGIKVRQIFHLDQADWTAPHHFKLAFTWHFVPEVGWTFTDTLLMHIHFTLWALEPQVFIRELIAVANSTAVIHLPQQYNFILLLFQLLLFSFIIQIANLT